MIAEIKVQANWEELEEADRLGLPKPEVKYIYTQFGFNLNDVELYYITDNDTKDITLIIKGAPYVIKYDLSILNKLKVKFSN